MRYRLRTLLILLAVMPPLLAGAWWGYGRWRDEQSRREIEQLYREGKLVYPPMPVFDPEA